MKKLFESISLSKREHVCISGWSSYGGADEDMGVGLTILLGNRGDLQDVSQACDSSGHVTNSQRIEGGFEVVTKLGGTIRFITKDSIGLSPSFRNRMLDSSEAVESGACKGVMIPTKNLRILLLMHTLAFSEFRTLSEVKASFEELNGVTTSADMEDWRMILRRSSGKEDDDAISGYLKELREMEEDLDSEESTVTA